MLSGALQAFIANYTLQIYADSLEIMRKGDPFLQSVTLSQNPMRLTVVTSVARLNTDAPARILANQRREQQHQLGMQGSSLLSGRAAAAAARAAKPDLLKFELTREKRELSWSLFHVASAWESGQQRLSSYGQQTRSQASGKHVRLEISLNNLPTSNDLLRLLKQKALQRQHAMFAELLRKETYVLNPERDMISLEDEADGTFRVRLLQRAEVLLFYSLELGRLQLQTSNCLSHA